MTFGLVNEYSYVYVCMYVLIYFSHNNIY